MQATSTLGEAHPVRVVEFPCVGHHHHDGLQHMGCVDPRYTPGNAVHGLGDRARLACYPSPKLNGSPKSNQRKSRRDLTASTGLALPCRSVTPHHRHIDSRRTIITIAAQRCHHPACRCPSRACQGMLERWTSFLASRLPLDVKSEFSSLVASPHPPAARMVDTRCTARPTCLPAHRWRPHLAGVRPKPPCLEFRVLRSQRGASRQASK